MLGELCQDIMGKIGTNPKYPPVNNLDWLVVDTATYDNYPSDNNSVRIQPKLSDLWNPNKKDCGLNLIPNQSVQPLGLRSADKDKAIVDICCEAKKAMMKGYTGKKLAEYLRARFDKEVIEASKDEMVNLSKEQGLLGNVYIDASAFSSSQDAEQFLSAHKVRLAQDILINDSVVNEDVIGYLANKFHKNVVSKISYDQDLFDKYKAHLVAAGKIDSDYKIDSKESLRRAFLSERVKKVVKTAKSKNVVRVSKEDVIQELSKRGGEKEFSCKLSAEDIRFRNVRPIVEFTRLHFSKGKVGGDLKEVLRRKYASNDLNNAAKYIAVVISRDITSKRIDKLVEENKISKRIGNGLKEIIKDYPLKPQVFENYSPRKQIGVPGSFHVLSSQVIDNVSEDHLASVKALRKGASFSSVKDALLKKYSNEEADKILLKAVKVFNETPAGVVANPVVIPPKKKVVADIVEKEVLPHKDSVLPQMKEFMGIYKGSNDLVVDIDDRYSDTNVLEVQDLGSKSGIDSAL